MITSDKNPKIKHIRLLQTSSRKRKKDGLFVIEGVRLVEEAKSAGCDFDIIIYSDFLSQRGCGILNELRDQYIQMEEVSPKIMRLISDTESPQGILAVVGLPKLEIPEYINFVLILDAVRDPGNLGTIMRTAVAAGVQVVFLSDDSTDPYSPKVLRSGMGAHFSIPIQTIVLDNFEKDIAKFGLRKLLADVSGGSIYTEVDLRVPLALIIGGEAEGVGDKSRLLADECLHIPMAGGNESLNAAVAAGILMFEVVRQRSES